MKRVQALKVIPYYLIVLCLLSGCDTAPTVAKKESVYLSGVHKVLLMPPAIECQDIKSGAPCPLDPQLHDAIQTMMLKAIHKELTAEHIAVAAPADPSLHLPPDDAESRRLFTRLSLGPGQLSEADQQRLSSLATDASSSHVLSSRCRLYQGPWGFWEPLYGEIRSSASRMVVEVLLFSAKDKSTVWSNTTQSRVSKNGSVDAIQPMVSTLLSTLNTN